MRVVTFTFLSQDFHSWQVAEDCVLVGALSTVFGIVTRDPQLTWTSWVAGQADGSDESFLIFMNGVPQNTPQCPPVLLNGLSFQFLKGQEIFVSVGTRPGLAQLFFSDSADIPSILA